MTLEGNYSFAGIGAAEAKDRENEHRVGTPPAGRVEALASAPIRFTTGVRVVNQGGSNADVRLAHGLSVKTQTAEMLTAQAASATRYTGALQFRALVPGSVTFTEAGAPVDVVDNGSGVLHDIGIPANTRGTINYANGAYDLTWGAAATEQVSITYQHRDYTEFQVAQSASFTAAGSYPEQFQTQFGRLVPGQVALDDGALVFNDDGKGNMIQTTGGTPTVRGTVDYATGVIDLTSGSGTLSGVADAVTIAAPWNPFGALLVAGGGAAGVTLLPGDIPELTSEPFADGIKGESRLALVGQSRDNNSTNLLTYWAHHVEEPYRVKEEFTAFPAGGASNDPRIDQGF